MYGEAGLSEVGGQIHDWSEIVLIFSGLLLQIMVGKDVRMGTLTVEPFLR